MRMLPIVDRLETQFADQMAFVTLASDDPEKGQPILRSLRMGGHPGYVILRHDGTEVQRHFGSMTEAALVAAIQTVLAT
jgi:hypothetical protein